MDSRDNSLLIGSNLLLMPNGLALDLTTQTLYFCDSKLDILARSRADGTDFTILLDVSDITGSGQSNVVYLDYHEGTLYFNDRREDIMFKVRVSTSGKLGPPVRLVRSQREIGNIKVVDPDQRQPLVPSE
jgi:hypothetical protein